MTLTYQLDVVGWATAMIAADDRHRETSVSYLSDGLEAMTDQPEPQRGFINQPRVAPQRGATLGHGQRIHLPRKGCIRDRIDACRLPGSG